MQYKLTDVCMHAPAEPRNNTSTQNIAETKIIYEEIAIKLHIYRTCIKS